MTIGKPGAIVRLTLSAAVTFLVAIQATHATGTPLNGWAVMGAIILTLKEIQSYVNPTWGNAFGQTPDPSANIAPGGTERACGSSGPGRDCGRLGHSRARTPLAAPGGSLGANWAPVTSQGQSPVAATAGNANDAPAAITAPPVITEKSPDGGS